MFSTFVALSALRWLCLDGVASAIRQSGAMTVEAGQAEG
jgi:hypothetical protein